MTKTQSKRTYGSQGVNEGKGAGQEELRRVGLHIIGQYYTGTESPTVCYRECYLNSL